MTDQDLEYVLDGADVDGVNWFDARDAILLPTQKLAKSKIAHAPLSLPPRLHRQQRQRPNALNAPCTFGTVAMTSNRGGPGRGQGRKPVKQGEETVTVSLRMTPEQRAKLARLGGAEWVRTRINKAKEPAK